MKLPNLHVYTDVRGKRRSAYRRTVKGKRKSIPIRGEIGSAEWHAAYNRLHDSFQRDSILAVKQPGTFSDLAPRWIASLEGKSDNTMRQYRRLSHSITKMIGDQKIEDYRVKDIYNFQDALADIRSPSVAASHIMVLKLLFKYAKRRGLIETNPAENIEKPAGYKKTPYRAWSNEEIQAALTQAPEHIVRAVMVLLCTGLRISDAVELRWGTHISSQGFIEITTQKTDTEVSVPISDELGEELNKPRRGLYLLLSSTGRKYSAGTCSTDIRQNLLKLGIEDPPPPHGLRKNAVMKLIEDGNDYRVIAAITGQSDDMIAHYGRAYERRRLAINAVITPRFGKG